MNKYLNKLLRAVPVSFLNEIALKQIKKKNEKNHSLLRREVFSMLYPVGTEPVVLNGPFAGMKYLNEAVWGSITPRWIGSYESILWPAMDEIIRTPYQVIIDVGCAEGYYVAGLSRLLKETTFYAFDLDAESRSQLSRLCNLNKPHGRVIIGERFKIQDLDGLFSPRCLLICDIEGGEMHLLDPLKSVPLRNSDVLVEIHRAASRTVEQNMSELQTRFSDTHEIVAYQAATQLPCLTGIALLSDDLLRRATAEGRPYPQSWLWMKSRGNQ